MTGRNGCVFVAAICLGLLAPSARGGDLNPPAAPDSAASAMWTLNDIYNVLDTRTTNVARRAGATAFQEPAGGPTNGTMRTPNEIMALVTNRAPVPRTGLATSYASRDDGALQVGVAWPTQRFVAVATSGAATNQIRDNLTGLIWARDANFTVSGKAWRNAINYIAATNASATLYGGANDWRLPNVRELFSLLHLGYNTPALCDTEGTAQWTEGNPFTDVQSSEYWTSSTYISNTNTKWRVRLDDGEVSRAGSGATHYVWPVRGP
jgi:hypothetical protein